MAIRTPLAPHYPHTSVGDDAPIAPYAPLLAKTLSLRGAERRGNPYSLRAASHHYVSVGGGDCPPSCQPIFTHCRGRQSGHFLETASLLPPPAALRRFPRRPACTAPPRLRRAGCPHPAADYAWNLLLCVRAGFYPARFAAPPVTPRRAAPMCAAARHTPHSQKMSLRTGAHAGVAIRTPLAPHYPHTSVGDDAHIVPSAHAPTTP